MTRKMMSRSLLTMGAAALTGLALFGSNTADAFRWVFPYNHPDLQWYTIETEHFLVHYPKSRKGREEGNEHALTAEWSARKYATVAEEAWQPMCSQFNYFLKEKINVVVLNQGDDLEGFTVPTWDWIVMSTNPGGTFYRGRGRMEWFSDVFVHEFAHVVSLKANAAHSEGTYSTLIGGLYENGVNRGVVNQTATGVEVPIGDGDSVFWTEGGAEYWSDNANYNWWTPSRDQNIRMTVLEDRLLEYSEWHTRANKSQSGWNDHERYYQQGYSFGLYIRERFGADAYARFALEYGKRWRPMWETVIEDVVGVDAETLYWDWRAYVTERYQAQRDRILARGEVVGQEVLSDSPEWDYTTPEERDEYYQQEIEGWFGTMSKGDRERQREATGRYQWEPRISPDGQYLGWLKRGVIKVQRKDEDEVWAWTGAPASDPVRNEENQGLSFSIPYATFEHGWDFVPGKDALVITGHEEEHPRGLASELTGIHLETDGYDWKRLYYFAYPDLVEEKQGNRTVQTRTPTKGFLHNKKWNGEWYQIPNTERGTDPAVCSDGERVAYLEYTDGTMNIVTIDIDGDNKERLTSFDDGTWFQVVDWSPDCSKLVFGMFRNYQQNLYIANADGSDITPIMVDEWEELDASWSAYDGKIYFSADPDGVFNIYSYDPDSKEFLQITNVVAGASSPQISADGNLLYSYYTSFGWKIYGLAHDEFLNAPANHLFDTSFDMAAVNEGLAFREDMSEFDALTSRYRPMKGLVAPLFIPIYRLENDTLTNWGMQGGFQAVMMDAVQYHQASTYVLLGEDSRFHAGYTYDGWYPSFSFFAGYYRGKNDSGYLLDADNDPLTTDDQTIYEIRRSYSFSYFGGSMGYQWNNRFLTNFVVSGLKYSIQSIDSAEFQPYMWWVDAGITATWSNNAFFARSINPSFGRNVNVNLFHSYADIVFEDYGGVDVDDGELLDNYQFNQVELHWTEQLPIPTFGGIPFLRHFQEKRHTIQLDAQLGFIDRNVTTNNEFIAGGRHPYNWGYGSIQSNTQFAGYPAYSLAGETLAIFNGAYRFPLPAPEWHRLIGPLFIYDAAIQLGGTAGNLWSFRPPDDPELYYRSRFDERIAYNKDDICRELFTCTEDRFFAYKNGNNLLTDISAELRLSSVLYHGMPWDSFFRVAYGFQEVRGYGDVDGNDIFDTNDSAVGDELSNETEPPGLRFYLGLGTGW